jgi:hypothetical protein
VRLCNKKIHLKPAKNKDQEIPTAVIFREPFNIVGYYSSPVGNGMLLELLDLLIGIAFGFFHKGKEDYVGILRNGAIIGIVVSLVFVLVMNVLAPGNLSVSFGYLGTIGVIVEILIFVVIFMAGTFIGDRIESAVRK